MIYKTTNYSIELVKISKQSIILDMKFFSDIIYTSQLNNIVDILMENLPTVFESKCFNGRQLSFFDECKNTEIAHLYEHVMLDLFYKKLSVIYPAVKIKGCTYWLLAEKTSFKIKINCKYNIQDLFDEVFEDANELFEKIYAYQYVKVDLKV